MSKKAIVIGSGIAGIAAAIRLKVKGYDVAIYEKNEYTGGKISLIEKDGFRFDAGPSVFTLPQLVLELFELAGKNPKDYFEYVRHSVSCNYFWNDGTTFSAPGNKESFIESAAKHFNEPATNLKNYFAQSERKFNITRPVFLEKSLHRKRNYVSKIYLKSYPHLIGLDILKSLNAANKRKINHPKLVQIFDKFACYNGSSPYKTSGVMSLMPHLEVTVGTFFPKEGMHAISQSLTKLCRDLGIEIHLNKEVTKIVNNHHHVTGIEIANEFISADLVVSNSDVYFTHKNLLNSKNPPKAIEQERSSSVVVFYWGVDQTFKQLDLHNMFFSDNYQDEFKAIFDSKTMYSDPSIYIHKSCEVVKSDAPTGKENWFVMIMVPSEPKLLDDEKLKVLRTRVISKLDKLLNVDLAPLISVEEILTPQLIEQKTNSYKGALHGTSSNSIFSAFLRHSNFSKTYNNLYFVGGSAHPGGGIPLCLLSAKIATEHA